MENSEFYKAVVELEEDKVLSILKKRLEKGEDPYLILEDCKKAMTTIGEKFEKEEYFLNDLIIAGEIFKTISEILKPKLEEASEGKRKLGTIVIGTVKGDIHDLGKNIVKILLEAQGFQVYDLGVDVSPDTFVEAVKKYKPDIVGMSCLITVGWKSIEKTIQRLKEENLRDKVKIILGGAVVNERIAEKVGADAWTNDAKKGVDICKKFVGAD